MRTVPLYSPKRTSTRASLGCNEKKPKLATTIIAKMIKPMISGADTSDLSLTRRTDPMVIRMIDTTAAKASAHDIGHPEIV